MVKKALLTKVGVVILSVYRRAVVLEEVDLYQEVIEHD